MRKVGKPQTIRLSNSERERLTQLAKATTGGNQSAVIRALIRAATPETVKQALAEARQAEAKR